MIDILIDARDKLNERKANIRRKLEAMETIKEGERVAPSFFRKMKTSFKKEEIYALADENKQGKETTKQEEINDIATDFYTDLWKNRRGTREFSERRRTRMIHKIKHKISNESRDISERPLTLEEVKGAMHALHKNKSQGIDGIPAEFYQAFDYATEWLYKILLEASTDKPSHKR